MENSASSNIAAPDPSGKRDDSSGSESAPVVQMDNNLAAIHGVTQDIHRNIREIVIGSLIGIAIWVTIGALTLGILGAL